MINLIKPATGLLLALGILTTNAAVAQNALPTGRSAVPIEDGVYPASYFPNTEILGESEMRITALGTGMPNQTKAAVSISFYVELGDVSCPYQ